MKIFAENSLFRFTVDSFRKYQLLRFLSVGTLNTVFSFGVYSFLVYLGVNFRLANLAALVLGILFSFKTQSALVFLNRENRRLARFILGWAAIYFATIGLIGYLISLNFDPYSAGALAVPFSTACSYWVQKHFVFQIHGRGEAEQARISRK
jgi:putative flippase GtrA